MPRQPPPANGRSKDWDTYHVRPYERSFLYVLDYDNGRVTLPGSASRRHDGLCNLISNFFRHCSNFKGPIHVNLPAGSSQDDWEQYWEGQLANKGAGDLIFIYYHGKAYGANRGWMFEPQGAFNDPINAYDFITKVNRTAADVTFLLDCYSHNRIKWPKRQAATTEILLAPPPIRNRNGDAVEHNGDFTKVYVRRLRQYTQDVDEYAKVVTFWDWRLMSMPQLVKDDPNIYHNTDRVWDRKSSSQSKKYVYRIKSDPVMARQTGRLVFHQMQLRPKKKDDWVEAIDIEEDEGLGMEIEEDNSQGLLPEDRHASGHSLGVQDSDDSDDDGALFVRP